ncbi:hypothetical protein niasHT_040002 [Heterodera trifolii]|uniref:B30.2/SPRY domain-containing protein n=1 Tax=Heterodera trifolii TaxID=157864 RepID=A0ABD2J5I3_9BILA
MTTFSAAHLIILIGIGLCASSVCADEQQNKAQSGGGLKHLLALDGLRENQNVITEKMSGIEAKLEQIENGMSDNQNVIKLRQNWKNKMKLILEQEIKNAIRENQNALAEKMSGIEAKLEKQNENGIRDNHKEPSSVKNNSTLALFHFPIPIYQWNASDCDTGIMSNTNSIQRNATDERLSGFYSCRAGPIQMPSAAGHIGIIYTEYRIINNGLLLRIGLSTKEVPLDTMLGLDRVSYGYANVGKIQSKNANGNYAIISDNVPRFDTGDVVGCGLNWPTRQVFFTKNGQRLDNTNLYIDEHTADFYPTVSMFSHGATVEANFGPNFQYDVSKEF